MKSLYNIFSTTIFIAILVLFVAPNAAAQNAQKVQEQATEAAKQLKKKVEQLKIESHSTHDGHKHSDKTPIKIEGGRATHAHDHNHDGHDHSGHNHGHDHSGHDHGHDHGKANKNLNISGGQKKGGAHGGAHAEGDGHGHAHGDVGCGCEHYTQNKNYDPTIYDPVGTAMGHIADANEFHILGHKVVLPLPVMLYTRGKGWTTGTTSMFHHGHKAVDGYVLDHHGRIKRIKGGDAAYMQGDQDICTVTMWYSDDKTVAKPKYEKKDFACVNGRPVALESASALDGGLFGGGITSYYDFSITKNVFTMMLASLLLMLLFIPIARKYKARQGMAPKGSQSLMETMFVFIRDEVTRPMIGEHAYEKYQPFIMTLFFFVLAANILGLIPFFPGSANVTGNLAVTMALALLTLIITTVSGNKHYWEHVLWMPGIPWWVKVFVLTPVEILGLLIKPFSLMIRLFANITAGHIIILSLIGLIFIFGKMGTSIGGAAVGGVVGGAFTAFMYCIELIVAFIQAFIFATLSASYIGAAVEQPAHHH